MDAGPSNYCNGIWLEYWGKLFISPEEAAFPRIGRNDYGKHHQGVYRN